MNVSSGDYLIAIDGKKLTKGVNPYSFLLGKANKNVMVTISKLSNTKYTRTIQVKPHKVTQNGEDFLRYHQWVQNNARLVSKTSDGRIGYIHIPDTYLLGFESIIDGFSSQINKEALIVDVRYNSGGYSPSLMIGRMNLVREFRWKVPNGKVYIDDPGRVSYSPKVCLINEWAESGGDMFAHLFRKYKAGLLIGKRTTGIMAGAGGAYLIDKGYVIFPVKVNVDKQGKLVVENVGVSPDIEITNRPEDLMSGKDAQLERAIEEILKKLDLKK
jgi:tricorn protease